MSHVTVVAQVVVFLNRYAVVMIKTNSESSYGTISYLVPDGKKA